MDEKLKLMVSELLDAWEEVPNDEKSGMTPSLDKVGEKIENIHQLLDEPYV